MTEAEALEIAKKLQDWWNPGSDPYKRSVSQIAQAILAAYAKGREDERYELTITGKLR